ncbi:hypothetical protein [Streptomyces zingiberis]|uniref:Integral membrane protein n=1 Tax=Streptomyces zingiberis TaxID=2053010 RepID=A0ABX1BQK0_9ACTN|nr:hypothetical protein [Streptomyces zingiberis]NJP99970.1 hypothetical protein [Streptomyces zingiberis]
MGIRSDQLVLDYLSRVGDLAQQSRLPSGDRMKLVSELRRQIDQERTVTADNPGAVKRILGRLGTPEDVVREAGGRLPGGTGPDGGDGAHHSASPRVAHGPAAGGGRKPRRGAAAAGPGGNGSASGPGGSGDGSGPGGHGAGALGALRRLGGLGRRPERPAAPEVPGPRESGGGEPAAPSAPEPPVVPLVPLDGPAPPHLAGEDELRGADGTEWWRVEPGPFGASGPAAPGGFAAGHFGPGDSVPGFVGGIEIPEILKPPPQRPFEQAAGAGKAGAPGATAPPGPAGAAAAGGGAPEPVAVRGPFRRGPARVGTPSPLLLLAAALLIGGALLGSLLALAAGWLIAYAGPRLSRAEAKWAALALPGLVAGGALVWLWGRLDGRWGEQIRDGAMSDAISETWPIALRAAAVASAVFLLWRARRVRG